MQLHLNRTSPYARVARIIALELGLDDRLELVWSDPWADEPALLAANPCGRVPVLITDDGESIAESLLIAQYLQRLSSRVSLLPDASAAGTLHLAGIGYGLMEAAFNTVIQRKHHGKEADASVLGQRRLRAIERSADALEARYAETAPADLTMGDIIVMVALDYLTFRLPELQWPVKREHLQARYSEISSRQSFRDTAFS
ncbi:glutathione S-transferase N-terminal domain-containing protein [Halopseudomonas salegens]|uniref:Glutathione S-transferase n=1 Tax=Halopseudomonas salegens TaxID=1434072 RepID=A0A1H2HE47_9GAMM|nr:glutathione S-transferase N-terminal domain-containing protein [Halopseudomonas salegens]SDU30181.1 glutathione S-transferase [Halopseudomonas salegens]